MVKLTKLQQLYLFINRKNFKRELYKAGDWCLLSSILCNHSSICVGTEKCAKFLKLLNIVPAETCIERIESIVKLAEKELRKEIYDDKTK